MTDAVPADQIEAIVGVARHPAEHFARAVSSEQQVYILHSQRCLDTAARAIRARADAAGGA